MGMSQTGVAKVLAQSGSFRFVLKVDQHREIEDDEKRMDAIEKENRETAEHKSDFEVPLYNVWKQQEKTAGKKREPPHVAHGNSPVSAA
jgi:hypothetical protein